MATIQQLPAYPAVTRYTAPAAVSLMGPADPGSAIALMGPADSGGTPVMCPAR